MGHRAHEKRQNSIAPATAVVRGGGAEPENSPAAEPIFQTSAYRFKDLDSVLEANSGRKDRKLFFYSRHASPNQVNLEDVVATLDGAKKAAVTSSGMAAITASCFALLRPGDHVVASSLLYGGTSELLAGILPTLGVTTSFVDTYDPTGVRDAVRENTRAIYLETISNPTIRVVNLPSFGALAREASGRPRLIVDNTFATPYGCQPLALGADLCIHSLSKFMSGHNDLIGGVVSGAPDLIDRIAHLTRIFGWAVSPFVAWLALRGLRTLWVRMTKANENALRIAQHLVEHRKVVSVAYPGLPTHPDHKVASAVLQGGYGAMLAFELPEGVKAVKAFIKSLRLIHFTPTLGGVATSISHPATTSHRGLTSAERNAAQIRDGLIRMSVGIEDPADIIEDIEQALGKV